MSKRIFKTASMLLSTALCFSVAGGILRPVFREMQEAMTAHAATQGAQTENSEVFENGLLAPTTYQEYLPLEKPHDTAVCERFTAIADGKSVYIYDKNSGVYEKYTHAVNADASKNEVTKLQFDDERNLYFLDASAHLYALNPVKQEGEWQVERTGFTCSNFLIHGNELYFTTPSGTQTQLSVTELSAPDVSTSASLLEGLTSDVIAFYNGELYYAETGKYLNKINPKDTSNHGKPTETFIEKFDTAIVSMQVQSGVLTSSDEDGAFRAYNLLAEGALEQVFQAEGSYGAISAYDEKFYAVNGNIVREYDVKTQAFTSFEICAASPAQNRLNGAVKTALAGNRLFLADNGNARISVYNTQTQTFETPIFIDFLPSFLTASADKLLLADGEKAVIYDLQIENYGEVLATFASFNGKLAGIAEVYGTYYLVTENNYYYCLKETVQEDTTVWTQSGVKRTSTRYPKLLTSDAYGFLYMTSGTSVYRFSETDFLDPAVAGEELCSSLPTNTEEFAVDYEHNFYALADNAFYKYTAPQTIEGMYEQSKIDLSTAYVYGETDYTPTLTSFAFGIEENATYLLCDTNYLVQTDALELPTVKNIKVNGTDEEIFASESAEFSVVTVNKGALLVEFDLAQLQGAEVFPYLSFSRTPETLTALKIGETDKYALLANLGETQKNYPAYLVFKDACQPLAEKTYRTVYAEDEQSTGYLTNALPLYKFPFLCPLLTVKDELPRERTVTLLGEIKQLDYEYYHVAWTDENGERWEGYLPKDYVTTFHGAAKEEETHLEGAASSEKDNVWRLAYLLLGFAAICVLVDFLLLRKEKEEE